jgi:hypothetical protein
MATSQLRVENQPVKRRISVLFEDFMCGLVTVRLINPLQGYD